MKKLNVQRLYPLLLFIILQNNYHKVKAGDACNIIKQIATAFLMTIATNYIIEILGNQAAQMQNMDDLKAEVFLSTSLDEMYVLEAKLSITIRRGFILTGDRIFSEKNNKKDDIKQFRKNFKLFESKVKEKRYRTEKEIKAKYKAADSLEEQSTIIAQESALFKEYLNKRYGTFAKCLEHADKSGTLTAKTANQCLETTQTTDT